MTRGANGDGSGAARSRAARSAPSGERVEASPATPTRSPSKPRRALASIRRRLRGRSFKTFLVAACVLGVARIALPFALKRYVVHVIRSQGDYELELDDVDVGLWRGAYELDGLKLYDRRASVHRPFLESGRIDLSVQWKWLLRGAIVGEVVLHQPHLYRTFGSQAEQEPGEEEPKQEAKQWWSVLDQLFPFRIDRFVIRDGELRVLSETTDPPVDLYMSDFYLELLNLTNIRSEHGVLLAQLEAAGRPFGTGEFELRALFDPSSKDTRLDLKAEIRKVSLVDLNDALQAYANLDVEQGELAMYTEMEVSGDRLQGYVKTLVEHLQVLSWKEIHGPGDALEALWEGLVELAGKVLENKPHDRLATRIQLDGRLSDVQTDVGTLIGTLLRNAFVRAMAPVFEGQLDLKEIEASETGGAEQ